MAAWRMKRTVEARVKKSMALRKVSNIRFGHLHSKTWENGGRWSKWWWSDDRIWYKTWTKVTKANKNYNMDQYGNSESHVFFLWMFHSVIPLLGDPPTPRQRFTAASHPAAQRNERCHQHRSRRRRVGPKNGGWWWMMKAISISRIFNWFETSKLVVWDVSIVQFGMKLVWTGSVCLCRFRLTNQMTLFGSSEM